jgi:hypothetical protein
MSSGFINELEVTFNYYGYPIVPADQVNSQAFQNGRALGRAGSQVFAAYLMADGTAKIVEGATLVGGGLVAEPITGGGSTVVVVAGGAVVLAGAAEAGLGINAVLYAAKNPLRTGHAEKRASQDRPVGAAWSDARKAGQNRVFWDPEYETYVVRGDKGRVHFFVNEDGTLRVNSSIRNPSRNTLNRLRTGEWESLTLEQYDVWQDLLNSTLGGE